LQLWRISFVVVWHCKCADAYLCIWLLLILFWFFFWGTGVLYLLRQICGKNVVFPPFGRQRQQVMMFMHRFLWFLRGRWVLF
jgi:hypothetical protein